MLCLLCVFIKFINLTVFEFLSETLGTTTKKGGGGGSVEDNKLLVHGFVSANLFEWFVSRWQR